MSPSLTAIVRNAPRLERLDLFSAEGFKDYPALGELAALTDLNLSFADLDDLRFLENLHALKTLTLSSVTTRDHSAMPRLPRLETLIHPPFAAALDPSRLPALTRLQLPVLGGRLFLRRLTGFPGLRAISCCVEPQTLSFVRSLRLLEDLDIGFSRRCEVSPPFEGLKVLKTALGRADIRDIARTEYLEDLRLTVFRPGVLRGFDDMKRLRTLELCSTETTDLHALPKLESLMSFELNSYDFTYSKALFTLPDASSMPALESLELGFPFRLIQNPGVLSGFDGLRHLQFWGADARSMQLLSGSSNLESLKLVGESSVDRAFFEAMPPLRELILYGGKPGSHLPLDAIAAMGSLQALEIHESNLGPLSSLSALRDLESLMLMLNYGDDPAFLSPMTSLASLRLLVEKSFDLFRLPPLPSLARLDISAIQLHGLDALRRFPNLRSLHLSYGHPLSLSPLAHLEDLEELTIRTNTNNDLQDLPMMPNLKTLCIQQHVCSTCKNGQTFLLTKEIGVD